MASRGGAGCCWGVVGNVFAQGHPVCLYSFVCDLLPRGHVFAPTPVSAAVYFPSPLRWEDGVEVASHGVSCPESWPKNYISHVPTIDGDAKPFLPNEALPSF